MSLWYPTLEDCEAEIFPLIQARLSDDEDSPIYAQEPRGIEQLRTTFVFMRYRRYRTFQAKAAYLLCSIVTGHGFSNGNKRLAVTALLAFLIYNRVKIRRVRSGTYKAWMRTCFPGYRWKVALGMGDVHLTFLYHLAIALADRPTWRGRAFDSVRDDVARLFGTLYVRI